MEHWEIFRSPSDCPTLVQAGGPRPLTDGHGLDLQFGDDNGTHLLPGSNWPAALTDEQSRCVSRVTMARCHSLRTCYSSGSCLSQAFRDALCILMRWKVRPRGSLTNCIGATPGASGAASRRWRPWIHVIVPTPGNRLCAWPAVCQARALLAVQCMRSIGDEATRVGRFSRASTRRAGKSLSR
jgi:hypothetical protein